MAMPQEITMKVNALHPDCAALGVNYSAQNKWRGSFRFAGALLPTELRLLEVVGGDNF
jgi:hypothetical protein